MAIVVIVGVLMAAFGIVFVTELGAVAVDTNRQVRFLPMMEPVVIAVVVTNYGIFFSFYLELDNNNLVDLNLASTPKEEIPPQPHWHWDLAVGKHPLLSMSSLSYTLLLLSSSLAGQVVVTTILPAR